jgi:hypothetical protein
LTGNALIRGIGLLEKRYSVSEAKSAGVGTTLRSRFRAFYPHEVCVPSGLLQNLQSTLLELSQWSFFFGRR